jgi:beta-ureidopropionase
MKKIDNLYTELQKHLPPELFDETRRLLYGNECRTLDISEEARLLSQKEDFDLQAYGIDAAPEQMRPRRLVRIGAIQNKIVLHTDAPVQKQVWKKIIKSKNGKIFSIL